jgi:hypothetical protein
VSESTTLGRLATVIRSKNAGPFITTCDVMFETLADFERVQAAGVLTPELVAKIYDLPASSILGIYFYAPALAVKISFLKPVDSGNAFSRDIAGSSQHVPLLDVVVQQVGEA